MTAVPQVEVFPDSDALVTAVADRFVARANAAVSATGRFVAALSGGSTLKRLYALLATSAYSSRVCWPLVHLFWGDERWVPPTDPASNFRMTREQLLDHVPIPAENVHRVEGADAEQAAAAYEQVLRQLFATPAGPPRRAHGANFDLVLLGLGEDGHTASWFPGMTAVRERQRWVMAESITSLAMWRVTLTPVVVNAAAQVIVLVSGSAKAATLKRVLEGPHQQEILPAQAVAPVDGGLIWMIDAAAAELLKR